MRTKVIEVQGLPHTLTQADGNTFRLLAHQTKIVDSKLVSEDFRAEQCRGNILLIPVENGETKNNKGGTK